MKIKKIAFLLSITFILLGVYCGYGYVQNFEHVPNEDIVKISSPQQENTASYKVTHYFQKLDGTYEEEQESYTGVIGSAVEVAFKTVVGFSADTNNMNNVTTLVLSEDSEENNLKLFYIRKTFNVVIKNNNKNYGSIKYIDGTDVPTVVSIKFGESIYVEDKTLVVGSKKIVGKPANSSAQYDYYFDNWDLSALKLDDEGKFTINNEYFSNYSVSCSFGAKIREYNVSWVSEGKVLLKETYKYGETPVYSGSTPVKEKDQQYTYQFSNWSPSVKEVSGDVVYTAEFSKTVNYYKVTFEIYDANLKYGSLSLSNKSFDVPYGTVIIYNPSEPNKIKIGNNIIIATPSNNTSQYEYSFEFWEYETAEITKDITVKAKFKRIEKTYTVLWISEKEVIEVDSNQAYGSIPTYDGKAPTKPSTNEFSYKFTGWSPVISSVTKNVSYYAQYEQSVNTYTVKWEVENVIIETDNAVPYGSMPTFDGETPSKQGGENYYFVFEGWYKDITEVTENVTYTAIFSRWYTTNTVENESRVVINSSGLRTDVVFEVEELGVNRTFILPKDMETVLIFKASLKKDNIDYVCEEEVQVVVDLKNKFDSNRIYHVYMNIDGDIIEPKITMEGSKIMFNTTEIGSFVIYTEIIKEVKLLWLIITLSALIVVEAFIFYFVIVRKYRSYKRQIELSKVNSNLIIPMVLIIRYVTASNLVPSIILGVLFLGVTGFLIYCVFKLKQMKASIPSEEEDFIYIPTHDEEDTDIETCPVYTGPKRDTSKQRKQTYYDTPYRPIYYYQPIPIYQPGVINVETDDENDDEIIIEDGEIVRVHYKRSFMSRIIQGTKEIQDYYTILRNEIAAYSRLKSRVGWEHESIYTSRETIVLIKVKSDTLCVFLALDPSKYNKSKINFGDVGKIKKYKNVPMLIKIQEQKDLEDVIKLIDQICKKNKITKDESGNEDYHYEFRTDKELIDEGLIKEVKTYSQPVEEEKKDILTDDMIRAEINVSEAKEALTDEQALALIETTENEEKPMGNKKTIVNIGTLSRFFEANEVVNIETLKNKKIVSKDTGYVKILASGVLDKPLIVEANSYSIDAVKMILLTGGKVKKI